MNPQPAKPKGNTNPKIEANKERLSKEELSKKAKEQLKEVRDIALSFSLPYARPIANYMARLSRKKSNELKGSTFRFFAGKTLMEYTTKWMLDENPKTKPTSEQTKKIDKLTKEIDKLSRDLD